jgi:hypothetical protein
MVSSLGRAPAALSAVPDRLRDRVPDGLRDRMPDGLRDCLAEHGLLDDEADWTTHAEADEPLGVRATRPQI